ncbi:protoglobin domain-containing protein [Natrialbaceae archaeon A-gly3]
MSGDSDHGETDSMDAFGTKGLNDRIDPDLLQGALGIDAAELEWRKDFINFDEEDARRLADLEPVFRDHRAEIARNFYDNLVSYEGTLKVIGRSERTVEELKESQRAYLLSLGRGEYDEEYFVNRARIGMLHYLLDMPMKHYIGQYGVYYELLVSVLNERIQGEVVDATEAWALEELEDNGGFLSSLTGSSSGVDELPADLERTLRDAVDDGMADVLSLLRIMNLDMQMATDAYNYANKRRDVGSESEDDTSGEGLADDISEILASGGEYTSGHNSGTTR